MDLTVKLVMRAQAEGVSAIKQMREETAELAAAMKAVREAARAGVAMSPSTIGAFPNPGAAGRAYMDAIKEMTAPAKEAVAVDPEKMFRGQVRRLDQMSKVRLAESKRVASAEAAAAKATAAAQKREAEGVLDFKRRMWAQQGREAETEATAEARAAEQAAAAEVRAAQESLRANMAYWRQRGEAARRGEAEEAAGAKRQQAAMRRMIWGVPGFGGGGSHGGHGRRSIGGELAMAAEYTLTYGAINKVLEGMGAIASSPVALGRMTLGVADQAREIKQGAADLGVSVRAYQDLRYAFAAKGFGEDRVQPMLQMMEKNTVAAIRHGKGAAVAFKALGLSVKQLKADSSDPMKLLLEIGDALERIRNPAKKVAIADMIFGRDGSKYLSLFKDGFLRRNSVEADRSGAVMSDADLNAGQHVLDQWREVKLQFAGIRNETAAAAYPIMSQLLGDASSWLRENRGTIHQIIRDDFAELKRDLPTIERGFTNMANGALEFAREIKPALKAMTDFGNSPFAKYLFSGQLIPGGVDLSDAKHAAQNRAAVTAGIQHNPSNLVGASTDLWSLFEKAAREGAKLGGDAAGHVTVTVQALPGTAVTSVHTQGRVSATAAPRGQIQVAH